MFRTKLLPASRYEYLLIEVSEKLIFQKEIRSFIFQKILFKPLSLYIKSICSSFCKYMLPVRYCVPSYGKYLRRYRTLLNSSQTEVRLSRLTFKLIYLPLLPFVFISIFDYTFIIIPFTFRRVNHAFKVFFCPIFYKLKLGGKSTYFLKFIAYNHNSYVFFPISGIWKETSSILFIPKHFSTFLSQKICTYLSFFQHSSDL